VEVGVELLGPFNEQGDVVHSATPAGWVASVTHFGPYSGLGAAHAAVREWCNTHQHRRIGPNWEVYGHWEAHWNTDPSKIRTDVFYQVSPPAV
jgi:effector-binding domain-containing protein